MNYARAGTMHKHLYSVRTRVRACGVRRRRARARRPPDYTFVYVAQQRAAPPPVLHNGIRRTPLPQAGASQEAHSR